MLIRKFRIIIRSIIYQMNTHFELIKHNKLFQVMPYPNRSHGIYEGYNTRRHLYTMMADYFLKNLKS